MLDAVAEPLERRAFSLGLTRSDVVVGIVLALVMVVGGYFRFVGQNWDDYTHWHPDERFLTDVVTVLNGPLVFTDADIDQQYQNCLARYPDNGGRGGFFDAQCSTLNPNNVGKGLYVYGTLPTFLVRLGTDWMVRTTGDTSWGGYYYAQLVGRALSATAEMLVVLTVFFIGLQLHDKWIGLLAATLYACAVFSIQQAHFWTTDAMSNLFVTLAIWCAVRVQMVGGIGAYLGFGVFFGAALASRINTVPVVGLLLLAAGLRLLAVLDGRLSWDERQRALTTIIMGLAGAGFAAFLVFRIGNPYAFNGPGFFGLSLNPRWLQDVGEAQYLVSGNAESPPNWQWVGRTAYLFPFSNMVLWGMGIGLGLAGWLGWLWSAWRLLRGRAGALRNVLPFVWVLVYFAWLGKLWVMTMRYYLPMYPMLAVLAAWGLVELVRRANRNPSFWRRAVATGFLMGVTGFTVLWAVMFTNIYRHLFAPVQSTHWVTENVPADFSMQIEGDEGTNFPLVNIAVINRPGGDDTPLEAKASRYEDHQPYSVSFTATGDGVIRKVFVPHLGDPNDDPGSETLQVQISAPDVNVILADGTLTADLNRDSHVLGNAYDIPLSEPVQVQRGHTYIFSVVVLSGGPIISGGTVFAWEGDWDEVSLPKACAFPQGITLANDPPPGMASLRNCTGIDLWGTYLHDQKLQIYYDEETYKRDLMQHSLDNSDYLVISTNRRYDTQSRIPYRWPMTMQFYESLFNGQLGFELVKTFQETFELGPLKVSDQYLPTYDGPKWLNEFEAEEAFHVYDHPAVFIFRKSDAYTSANTQNILNSVTLNKVNDAQTHYQCPELSKDSPLGLYCDPTLVNVMPLYSLPASNAPTALQFPPDLAKIQMSGGTWSERFHSEAIINTQPVVTVLGWWLTIMIFGWAAWPLLFALFPGLADRGYSFAKAAGLLLVACLTWFISSARIPIWSQGGVIAALLLVAVAGLALNWHRRGEFMQFIRDHGRRLAWIEVITLLGFVVFLLIRLTNPDLWHTSFGGEKPMDFAYFNGVLRSTIFPAVDPWHSGGYINYYYFGYVIVGSPVLLLGVMPSIAYNLIIPTLFALTGIGAFSVAFNVVSAMREKRSAISDQPLGIDIQAPQGTQSITSSGGGGMRLGNPWVAGIAAMILAVGLGNLDTPRVFVSEGLMKTGYYQQPFYIQNELVQEYTTRTGQAPTGAALDEIVTQANSQAASPLQSALLGLRKAFSGQPLNLAPNRWYWAATRVIMEAPDGGGSAIAEFPFFTFLYGDLHAHMIAMPLMFLAMVFVLNEVLMAGKESRSRLGIFLALAFGALVVGMMRATNTWDWITFMALGILGLSFAWWIGIRRIQRASVIRLALRVGGFVLLGALFVLPYTTWYASVYSRALPWSGPKTQLWMYFTIHGLFLFLVVSLLIWDTGRWLRSLYVRTLRGTCLILVMLSAFVGLILLGALFMTITGYPVTIVIVPLLIWIGLLFFRQGQTREMQFVLALAGLALSLTLVVEYFVLDGDIGRQNTLFKFYIQVWLLFSSVGGIAIAWLIQSSGQWSGGLRMPWYIVLGFLVGAAGLYPIVATRGRALDRQSGETPLTLDGMEYMLTASIYDGDPAIVQADPSLGQIQLADDYHLIRWMQENIQGTPTIMEGRSSGEYHWEARISIMTGLPALNGWNFHQRQQRTFDPLPRVVEQRVANVNAFYVTTNIDTAWDILRHYDVSYVVVSNLERAYYPASGLAKLDEMVAEGMLDVVYQEGRAVLYQVNKDAQFELVEDVAGGI